MRESNRNTPADSLPANWAAWTAGLWEGVFAPDMLAFPSSAQELLGASLQGGGTWDTVP